MTYIFEQNCDGRELARLRLIEKALDPTTIVHLQQTGLRQGWQCLELGVGAGSIMRWLGSLVGENGHVTGVDKTANYLQDFAHPPFHATVGEFLDVPLDTKFDLAHCRYVLIHNRSADEMLKKLVHILRPGGFLVIEEPDFTSAKVLDVHCDASHQRVNHAMCRMFECMLLDPAYGLNLPDKVAAEALDIIEVDARTHLVSGGSPIARMMGASTETLADKYIATGEAVQADIDRYIKNAGNDQFWAVYYSTISVIARRPL